MPNGIKGFQKGHIVPEYVRRAVSDANTGKHVASRYTPERNKKISEANKGRKPSKNTIDALIAYNTGRKQSPETIAKRVSSRKGYKHSEETIRKISDSHKKGKDSHLWRGGITEKNKMIRKSLEYKLWRKSVFERDKYTCVWCGEVGGDLNADHIKPFAYYPELRFAIDNGRTLCVPCHRTTDTWGAKLKIN